MNSKFLLITCILTFSTYHYGYAMDNESQKIMDNTCTLPQKAFEPSGLSLNEDEAKCTELTQHLLKFNTDKTEENSDFSALEKAATQALIATSQYINNPALDPNMHQNDTDVTSKRFIAALKIWHLTSIQARAAYMQTPQGLQKLEKYRKEKEEKAALQQLVIKRAVLFGASALSALLFYSSL